MKAPKRPGEDRLCSLRACFCMSTGKCCALDTCGNTVFPKKGNRLGPFGPDGNLLYPNVKQLLCHNIGRTHLRVSSTFSGHGEGTRSEPSWCAARQGGGHRMTGALFPFREGRTDRGTGVLTRSGAAQMQRVGWFVLPRQGARFRASQTSTFRTLPAKAGNRAGQVGVASKASSV